MNLDRAVDGQNVLQHAEHRRWCFVDIEVLERGIAADVIKAIDCALHERWGMYAFTRGTKRAHQW